jgi:predicted GNAT family acetyltransferase
MSQPVVHTGGLEPPATGQFTTEILGPDDKLYSGYVDYVMRKGDGGHVMDLTHTFVPPELRGKGVAGIVVRAAFETAKENGLKIRPSCSYIPTFVSKNEEYADMVLSSSL